MAALAQLMAPAGVTKGRKGRAVYLNPVTKQAATADEIRAALTPGVGIAQPVAKASPYAFTPYAAPVKPPTGSYDPALDAQLGSANRGLGDFLSDYRVGGVRRSDDYLTRKGQLETQKSNGLEDLMRNYSIMGMRQTDALRSAGIAEGGATQQSQGIRDTNQARDTSRFTAAADQGLGALSLDYLRSQSDADNSAARATRENTQYNIDVPRSEWFQAGQSGLDLPTSPAHEKVAVVNGAPVTYRQITVNGHKVVALPDGTLHGGAPGTQYFGVTFTPAQLKASKQGAPRWTAGW